MSLAEPTLSALTPSERCELEEVLVRFDLEWSVGRLPAVVSALPAQARWRQTAAAELVKIDLERRWQSGERPTLDDYRTLLGLGPINDPPADLLAAEYAVRRQFGVLVDLDEYARRYPDQVNRLRSLAERTDQESARSTPGSGVTGNGPGLPERFGRYRILRTLGRGGMGTVYLAHDTQLDRQVALKIPHAGPGEGTDRMLREARAAAALEHPNICPVFDAGEVNGVPYLTSAFVAGEPLSTLVGRRPPVPATEAAALVAKVAQALDYAHRRGVVHRDLKPANVMLTPEGQPVVTDFGLARRALPDDPRTSVSGLAGSPAYMAPEQASAGATGTAADVYGLGVVLYELLAGRVPFTGSTLDVLAAVVSDVPPPPSRFRPGLDPRLEAICLKAMAKRPTDRFGSMAEFAAALESYDRRRRPAGRRVAVLVAVVLLVTGVLVGAAARTGVFGLLFARPIDVPNDPKEKGSQVRTGPDPLSEGEPPPEVRDQLAQMNDRENPDTRLDAIKRLADARYVEVGRALEARLSTPASKSVLHWSERREAAVALKALGDPAAAAALARRVADSDWMTERRNDAPNRNPGGPYVADPDAGGKAAALDALATVAADRVVPALRAALRAEEPLVRAWAATRLGDHPAEEVTAAVVAVLGDKSGLVRRRAAESLGRIADPAAADALATRIADDRWLTEEWGKLIGNLFAESFTDPTWGGKDAAVVALGNIAPERVAPALIAALGSKEPLVRAWAAERLSKHTGPATTRAMCTLLADRDELPRKRAAESLSILADSAAVPALAARVADAVWMLERRCQLTGKAIPEAFADPTWGGKADALTALRALDRGRAKEALEQAAQSPDADVRRWALAELGRPPK